MKRFLSLLILLSCAGPEYYGPPLCVSRCGLELRNAPLPHTLGVPSWTCEEFQHVEDVTLDAFDRHVTDARLVRPRSCMALQRLGVGVVNARGWESSSGNHVAGETYCSVSTLALVGNDAPEITAFPHELAHVLQQCTPMGPGYEGGHANWDRDGISAAIFEVWQGGWTRADNGWL